MLSIISAVKGIPELTQKAFNSIWENAANPKQIEHLIVLDCKSFSKDTETHDLLDEYKNFYTSLGININVGEVCFCKNPEGYKTRNLHRDYWNPLAKKAKGDIIFGLTNDCIIQTKNFDQILLDAFEQYKTKHRHDVVQFLVDDDSAAAKPEMRPSSAITSNKWYAGDMDKTKAIEEAQDKTKNDFCQWVILSKSAVETIGGIVPDEIQLEGGDQYVDNIFKNTPIPSQIDLTSEIIIEDHSWHTDRVTVTDEEKEVIMGERPILDQRAYIELGFINQKKPYHAKINYEIARQIYNIG